MIAVSEENLDNLKWIKRRYNLDIRDYNITLTNIRHFGIMKWLHQNGCPSREDSLPIAAFHGDLETMKWLYDKGCSWNRKRTFWQAALQGNLNMMKWLREKECPWDDTIFLMAVPAAV